MNPSQCAVLVTGDFSQSSVAAAAIRELERRGYSIWRIETGDAPDLVRSQAASEALSRGFAETFWIDPRLDFDPNDVVKVRAHQRPIVGGVYPAAGGHGLALELLPGTRSVEFGLGGGLMEVRYAAPGFLHVRKEVYETLLSRQLAPDCRTQSGSPFSAYFAPLMIDSQADRIYLDADFAFCQRARQCGFSILADTSIRLWRNDNYRYSWEDVAGGPPRNPSCQIQVAVPGENAAIQSSSQPADRSAPFQSPALDEFRSAHPWPEHKPQVPAREGEGWLFSSTQEMLSRHLSLDTRLVVELGSWLGLSTRFIAGRAPRAAVIAIDHWRGSSEHQSDPKLAELLAVLYETFLVNCWNERSRITPVRAGTIDGLERVARAGLQPDVIYVDADHSFEGVLADLQAIERLFPKATIVGDDWNWEGVRRAATAHSSATGRVLEALESGWCMLPTTNSRSAK